MFLTQLQEAWPAQARDNSIATRQTKAKLRKTTFYLAQTHAPGFRGDFSSRVGFTDPKPPADADTEE